MLRGGAVKEIQEMKREGLSVQEISRRTGFDRKTIRKYLGSTEVARYGPRAKRPSKLDPYQPYIDGRIKLGVWNAVVLLRELRARGYTGGYSVLKGYLQPLREASRSVAVRRFETAPGQQAQVDWGSLGSVITGGGAQKGDRSDKGENLVSTPLSGFVMTLGCSRAVFADVALDQTVSTLLKMHEEAFRQLGGVPQEILYDRPKTILLGVDDRGELQWNPTFLDFARYWGFTPRVCQGYRPQTKGKVESGIKYLKGNFLCGRSATSVQDLSSQVRQWTAEVANQRVHGTTHRIVAEDHALEKPHLQPIGRRAAYPLPESLVAQRRVASDSYINYGANRYSVPFAAVGQDVRVKETDGKLQVYLMGDLSAGLSSGKCLAEHLVCQGKHQVITVAEHVEGIPLGPNNSPARRSSKNHIEIGNEPPDVDIRDLAAYEALANETLANETLAWEVLYV